jgi:HEAT repeat protein
MTRQRRFLHLSDLHISQAERAVTLAGNLLEDLRDLDIDSLDAVIVSGDSTDRAQPEEFSAAGTFLRRVCEAFCVEPDRILVVPGNHDVNWEVTKRLWALVERDHNPAMREAEAQTEDKDIVRVVTDAALYKERLADFANYYRAISGRQYSPDYDKQWEVLPSDDERLLLVGLNSCRYLDDRNPYKSGFDPTAFEEALAAAAKFDRAKKIMVWHHPISGKNDADAELPDSEELRSRLVKAGFTLLLHGHVHYPKTEAFFREWGPDGQRLYVVGAGTLDSAELRRGFPWQYAIWTVDGDRLWARSRRKETPNEPWRVDDRWLWSRNEASDIFEIKPARHTARILQGYPQAGLAESDSRSLSSLRHEAESIYRDWLHRRYGAINVGQTEDTLESLYVPLRLLVFEDSGLSLATVSREERSMAYPGRRLRSTEEPDTSSLERSVEAAGLSSDGERSGATANERRQSFTRVAFGELVRKQRRFLVLGGAGAGKSTLLRWATAGLVHRRREDTEDPTFPDREALPEDDLLPVVVRCDSIAGLPRSLEDMLSQVVDATTVPRMSRAVFVDHLVDLMNSGKAALLVDGLDELRAERGAGGRDLKADRDLRIAFCARLASISLSYNQAPIVVTTRAAAFAEIEERVQWSFSKVHLSEWSPADKEAFAQRLARVTERDNEERRQSAEQKLKELIADPDQRELTSTPLMLASMASIISRADKLPDKRVDLYNAFIDTLLHKRSSVDDDEAYPQLHYLAYSMLEADATDRTRRELVMTLGEMRQELLDQDGSAHPFFEARTAVAHRGAEEFVDMLINDTDVLTVTDETKRRGRTVKLYGFHHPILRETLAGCAIANLQFCGASAAPDPAAHIAQLLERLTEADPDSGEAPEFRGGDPWVEAVRFAVACSDEGAPQALGVIVDEGVTQETLRPRAVLAALCLADAPPDVDRAMGNHVLKRLVAQIDARVDGAGTGSPSPLDAAALELARSRWATLLCERLVNRMEHDGPEIEGAVGGLCALVAGHSAPLGQELTDWLSMRKVEMRSESASVVIPAILGVMHATYRGLIAHDPELRDMLLGLLAGPLLVARAAAWALAWQARRGSLLVGDDATDTLVALCETPETDDVVRRRLLHALGSLGVGQALDIVRRVLDVGETPGSPQLLCAAVSVVGQLKPDDGFDVVSMFVDRPEPGLRQATAQALGELGDVRAVGLLVPRLHDSDEGVRATSAYALGQLLASDVGGSRATEGLTEEAIDALIVKLAEDSVPRVREASAWALGVANATGACEPLVACLHSKQLVEVRRSAATALGFIGGARAVAELDVALNDRGVRATAAEALASISDPDAAAVLFDRLASGETDLADVAEQAMWFLDSNLLLKRLEQMAAPANPPAVRLLAARLAGAVLRRTPADDPSHGHAIITRLLEDPDVGVRRAALEQLPRFADGSSVSALARLTKDPDPEIRRIVVSHLSELSSDVATPVLQETLADSDAEVLTAALAGLRRSHSPPLTTIRSLLAHSNSSVRLAAIGALGAYVQEQDVELFVAACADPDVAVRRAAVSVLVRWLAGRDIRLLQDAILDADDPSREQLVASLRRDDDGPAIAGFLSRLNHDDPAVRQAAADALGRIGGDRAATAVSMFGEPGESYARASKAVHERFADDPAADVRDLAARGVRGTRPAVEDDGHSGPVLADRERAFIVLLHHEDDAYGLAQLFEDVRDPEVPQTWFVAPAIRGAEFFTDGQHQQELDRWWSVAVPRGVLPVYVLMHEQQLAALTRGLEGEFYVGVTNDAASSQYKQLQNVTTFVAGGPLDFATVVMREFSQEGTERPIIFDHEEARRMAALASDFPNDLDDLDPLAAE